jgi:hypothetical protein
VGAAEDFHNATFLTRPDGSRVLAVNWAVGTPGNVRTLQIPEAYVGPLTGEVLCHPFGAQVDPDCRQDFMLTVLLRITLPDGGPPLATEDIGRAALVKLTSTVRAADPTGASFVSGKIADDLDEVRATTPRLRVLPALAGLHGFGLGSDVDPAGPALWMYSDIYFDGATPASSTVGIECSDPEADRRFGFNSPGGEEAVCIEYFALQSLSAVVTVNMTLRDIADWQKIRAGASTVIANFLQKQD